MTIGSWVRRPDQQSHHVESIIADEPVTHCGRRLKTRYFKGIKVPFEVLPTPPDLGDPTRCLRCV